MGISKRPLKLKLKSLQDYTYCLKCVVTTPYHECLGLAVPGHVPPLVSIFEHGPSITSNKLRSLHELCKPFLLKSSPDMLLSFTEDRCTRSSWKPATISPSTRLDSLCVCLNVYTQCRLTSLDFQLSFSWYCILRHI